MNNINFMNFFNNSMDSLCKVPAKNITHARVLKLISSERKALDVAIDSNEIRPGSFIHVYLKVPF